MNPALSPALLADYLEQPDQDIQQQGHLIAYPKQWQLPAATEKAAYDSLFTQAYRLDFSYVGFPWATLIDCLIKDVSKKWPLLRKLASLQQCLIGQDPARRVSVAQHIRADRYVVLFKACGITDLFWSHATVGRESIEDIRIHPFPLFPAQTTNEPELLDLERPRRYLANFIGAYTPGLYLTDVRQHIFRDAGKMDDVLIIQRDAWHFDRAVYGEQINGTPANSARVALERDQKDEYLQAIRDSYFTLCPTGSGPNSIRIWEVLALGSIPIVLTNSLRLPGPRELWERAALFDDDSEDGYRKAIARARAMTHDERKQKISAGAELFAYVGPFNYGRIIEHSVYGNLLRC